MKFFHLSDLHIGLKLMGHDLLEDQRYVLRLITEAAAAEQPDAVVIAGDIYDRSAPSAEAVEEFDRFVTGLHAAAPQAVLLFISGNHDSAARVNCFRNLLEEENVYMVGQPPRKLDEQMEKVVLFDAYGPVNFYLLPFVRPSMVRNILPEREDEENEGERMTYDLAVRHLIEREKVDTSERNVLVSHQFYIPAGVAPETVERADSEIVTVGNIDSISADVLELFDYAALGHIHKPSRVGCERYRYSGTPLACSVSEAGQQKGIVVVELGEKGAPQEKTGEECGSPEGMGEEGMIPPETVEECATPKKAGKERIILEESEKEGEFWENAVGRRPTSAAGLDRKASLRIRTIPLVPLREVRIVEGSLSEVLSGACGDYVSVRLTDPEGQSGPDILARLREAFPYLLEVRHVWNMQEETGAASFSSPERDPLQLCLDFLGETDEWEEEILMRVLHGVASDGKNML